VNADERPINSGNARRFVVDTDPYLSCEECFDLLDRFVESTLADGPGSTDGAGGPIVPDRFGSMRAHLAGCPACAEETAALVELVAAESGMDAGPVLRTLHD
jgi:hypothetical protein